MTDIQTTLKKRIIDDVIRAAKPVASKWKVLVVDALAKKVLMSCCTTHQILDENITLIESLESRRQPFPDQDAIYLLSPIPESIELFINDFTRTSTPPFAAIQKSPVNKNKYIHRLVELNLDFISLEPHAFTLDLPSALHAAINAQTTSHLNYELNIVAKRLVSVFATLGEYPYIRYSRYNTATLAATSNFSVTQRLAELVQDGLDDLCRNDEKFPPESSGYPGRAILIIVDRGIDVAAPLLHEFTYQAMVNDLLAIEDSRISNKSDGKMVSLDHLDQIWMAQKYSHIADVMQAISEGVKKFTTENAAANFQIGNDRRGDKIEQLKETLSAIPEYQEMKAKDCMGIFNRYQHDKLSTLEQNLVTGETSNGKPVKFATSDVENFLTDKSEDKLRLLMLHIIASEGLPDAERQRLFDSARLSRDEFQAVTNLSQLGVRLSESIVKKANDTNPYIPSVLKGGRGKVTGEVKFENSRYIPIIKHILEVWSVDSSAFPWVKEPPPASSKTSGYNYGVAASPSAGSSSSAGASRTKPSWARNRDSSRSSGVSNATNTASSGFATFMPGTQLNVDLIRSTGPRIIFFVLGGMAFSEIRASYEVMSSFNRDILIGSTHTITPHLFLDSLKHLHRSVAPPPTPNPYKLSSPVVTPNKTSPKNSSAPRSRSRGPERQKERSEGQSSRSVVDSPSSSRRRNENERDLPRGGSDGRLHQSSSGRDRERDRERERDRDGSRRQRDPPIPRERPEPTRQRTDNSSRGGDRRPDRMPTRTQTNLDERFASLPSMKSSGSVTRTAGRSKEDEMANVMEDMNVGGKKKWFGLFKRE